MTSKMLGIITDTHFGYKGNNKTILSEHLEYFDKIVFPYILKNNIKNVFHLGDLFDNRNSIDIFVVNEVKKQFIDFFRKNKINLYVITGNHDVYYKNTNEVNSLNMFSSEYIKIYYEGINELNLENYKIALIPWLNQPLDVCNHYDLILGHFEFKNFHFNKSIISENGLESENFSKFARLVLSGHYHLKSQKNNVFYLGSPYQLNWNDFNTQHGFYSIQDNKLKFIENNFSTKFIKIYYNEDIKDVKIKIFGLENKPIELTISSSINFSEYIKNNYIKIVVENIIHQNIFELFYDRILEQTFRERIEVINIKESLENLSNIDNIQNISEDIPSLIEEYFINTNLNNEKEILELFKEIFTLANSKEKNLI